MTEKSVDAGGPSRREHWESIYAAKAENEVSWFQAHPSVSLQLVARAGVGPEARIVDIGGGASRLVDGLLDAGFRHLTVLDIAEGALGTARRRLGERASAVTWIPCDVTSWRPGARFDVWHDRAVFHFLVEPQDRRRYLTSMTSALPSGAHAILGTFASDGPERCSNLPVVRYEPNTLAAELGSSFRLVDGLHEDHLTPAGTVQRFQFSRFVRV